MRDAATVMPPPGYRFPTVEALKRNIEERADVIRRADTALARGHISAAERDTIAKRLRRVRPQK